MRDSYHNVKPVVSTAPVVVSDNTPAVGAVIDRAGFESVTFLIMSGTLADTDITGTPLLEESDVDTFGGEQSAIADADLIGTEADAAFAAADDGEVHKLGYKGNKRYLRLTLTPANNTGSAPLAAVALLGHAHDKPVS